MASYTITDQELDTARAKCEQRIARCQQMANICDALTALDGKYYTKGLHEAIRKAAPTSLNFYQDISCSKTHFYLTYYPPQQYSDRTSILITTEDNKRRISAEDLRRQAGEFRAQADKIRAALDSLEMFYSQYNAAVAYAGDLLNLFSLALYDVKDMYRASLR